MTDALARSAATGSALARRAHRIVPFIAVGVFALAAFALHNELRHYRLHDLIASLRAIAPVQLLIALVIAAIDYAALVGVDALALRYAAVQLAPRRLILGSFIAYALSQNLGFPLVTGGSVRYRLWTAWGASATSIARAMALSVSTFWLGVLTIASGVMLAGTLPPWVSERVPVLGTRVIGGILLSLVAGYLGLVWARRQPFSIRGWQLALPAPRLALMQIIVATLDWTAAAGAAYVLLPASGQIGFPAFVAAYLLAQLAGIASHVPGGLGVFEMSMLLLLGPTVEPHALLASLLAYRCIYYLLPLAAAVGLFVAREVAPHRVRALRAGRAVRPWVGAVAPQVLAAVTFLSGALLLFSGSLPSAPHRLRLLTALVPLGVVEASHFVASVAGVVLVVLAWALARRLRAAYVLSITLLVIGSVASLFKGLHWEQALVLSCAVLLLLPARGRFYRRAAISAEPLSGPSVASVLVVVGASVWLMLFAFKHVEYSADLWWQFARDAQAPRALRATVGAAAVLLTFGFARLFRHARSIHQAAPNVDLDRAATVIARSAEVNANLALLGDKTLLFNEAGTAFIMFAVAGRSWIVMGDPIGPQNEWGELAWELRVRADRHGGWTVFYEVSSRALPLCVDLGLTLVKVGEEAVVWLDTFNLEGSDRKALRRTHRDATKRGVSFEVVAPEGVPALLPQLRSISDRWLASKRAREKGFSLGRFDSRYLRHFPMAVVRLEDRIVAFANLWTGAPGETLSVDLMRHADDAPRGIMDYLFIELMLWGRARGYRRFSLGMTPLGGLRDRALAPIWNRLASLVYRHGERFYHFRGLRQYKEKFAPSWEPRYLAAPGGLALPRVLANVVALISGAGGVAKERDARATGGLPSSASPASCGSSSFASLAPNGRWRTKGGVECGLDGNSWNGTSVPASDSV